MLPFAVVGSIHQSSDVVDENCEYGKYASAPPSYGYVDHVAHQLNNGMSESDHASNISVPQLPAVLVVPLLEKGKLIQIHVRLLRQKRQDLLDCPIEREVKQSPKVRSLY